MALVGVPSPLAKGRLLVFLMGCRGAGGVCVFVVVGALGMFGARPFPASVRGLARLSRRSAGNLRRRPGYGVDWVVDCVLFILFFLFWLWWRSLGSFLFVFL